MTGRIPQSFVDELLARTDIVEVVDSRVRLKKAGKNYSACCPFHSEKTPSFTVSSQKQFYYCFGCGASGNAIGFVMEYDSLSFPEAIEQLAAQSGLEVPRDEQRSKASEEARDARNRCYQVLEQAAEFYARQLKEHSYREVAVPYLKGRGLNGQIAKAFQMGLSPPGWDSLMQRFQNEEGNLDPDMQKTLLDAGLLIENDQGRIYDRFRGRIMFPIRDVRGRVLGFGARTLGDEKPKYLNSPETLAFHKGSELYGLYECRKSREPVRRILVTEGYMDVVALAQQGIQYAVATLGTATSTEHLQRLFKFVPEIVFCFDGDDAGRRASHRAAEQALPLLEDGRQLKFLFLPENEDPDSLVRQEGKAAFEQRIENQSLSLGDYLFRHYGSQVDEHSMEGRARLSHLMLPDIQQLPDGLYKQLMLDRLAARVGVSSQDLIKTKVPPKRQAEPQSSTQPLGIVAASAESSMHGAPAFQDESEVARLAAISAEGLKQIEHGRKRVRLVVTNLLLCPRLANNLHQEEVVQLSERWPELIPVRTLYEGVFQLQLKNEHEVLGYFLAHQPHQAETLQQWISEFDLPDPYGVVPRQKAETVLQGEIEDVLGHYRRLSWKEDFAELQAKHLNQVALSEEERQRFAELLKVLKGQPNSGN